MNTSVAPVEPPTKTRSFFRGFRSGAVNSSIMLGIFSLVTLAFPVVHFSLLAWNSLAVILTTGLFSGVMSAKKAAAPSGNLAIPSSRVNARSIVMVPSISPDMAPTMEMMPAPEPAQGSWVERTGSRGNDRVQQILDNGALSDKDRASAILAERAQAAGQSNSVG